MPGSYLQSEMSIGYDISRWIVVREYNLPDKTKNKKNQFPLDFDDLMLPVEQRMWSKGLQLNPNDRVMVVKRAENGSIKYIRVYYEKKFTKQIL